MAIEVDTVTAPDYWASYLVNGDHSGLESDEKAACDVWQEGLGDWYVVDVARDESGEAQEPRFTWSYSLYGGTASGGSVVDYVAHKVS